MTLSQMDKFLPLGQRNVRSHHPQNDKEMLTMLKTFERHEQVVKTLDKIKCHVSFDQNQNNLTKDNKDDLKKSLGYLLGTENYDNERITMPKFCGICKHEDPYYSSPGDCPEQRFTALSASTLLVLDVSRKKILSIIE